MAVGIEITRVKSTEVSRLDSSNVQWLSPDDDSLWDAFVTAHPLGLIYHLSAWKQVLADALPHIRGRFLALTDPHTGEIQAGMPVYTVKSWLLGNRTVSIPFASFCDPLVSTRAEFQLLLARIEDFTKEVGSRKTEIRSVRTVRQCATSYLSPSTEFKHHYLNLDREADALYASFAKSSICQKVSKAHRSGVVVEERFDEESLRISHSILVDTRRRHSLPPMPFVFFESMRRRLGQERLKIFLAIHQGKPMACHLVLMFKDWWISEYSGNRDSAMAGVNQLLYWETIRRAQGSGAKWFSFGRTAISNSGLLEYKRRWATVEEDLIYFRRVLRDTSTPAGAVEQSRTSWGKSPIARWLIGRTPIPIYHGIGNFCYRHLG